MDFWGANSEIFSQLILAAVLGVIIGVERELAKKTAGMKTYALVSLGSALFSILSVVATAGLPYADPARIASQVVVGVGFIGAGLIVFHQSKISGLTSAAGLWVAAAVGMAVGFKFYAVAVFATLLTVLTFVALWFVEQKFVRKWSSEAEEV